MLARKNAGAGRKGYGVPNLLAGLACCGVCNGSMAFIRGGKRSRPSYLRCASALRGAGCENTARFLYQQIENALLDTIGVLAFDPPKRGDDPSNNLMRRLEDVRGRKARAMEAANRLITQIEDSDELPRTLVARIKAREAEADQLSREAMLLEEQIAVIRAQTPIRPNYDAVKQIIAEARRSDLPADDLFAVRVRMQAALREVIDFVVMNPKDRSATVLMAGAALTFVIEHGGAYRNWVIILTGRQCG